MNCTYKIYNNWQFVVNELYVTSINNWHFVVNEQFSLNITTNTLSSMNCIYQIQTTDILSSMNCIYQILTTDALSSVNYTYQVYNNWHFIVNELYLPRIIFACHNGIEYWAARYFGMNDKTPATPIIFIHEEIVITMYTGLRRTRPTVCPNSERSVNHLKPRLALTLEKTFQLMLFIFF